MKPPAAAAAAAGGRQRKQPKQPPPARPAELQPQPMRPRPRLFFLLMIVFALWVAGLVTMYFTTVRPRLGPVDMHEQRLDR
jgi:hypothetical protein